MHKRAYTHFNQYLIWVTFKLKKKCQMWPIKKNKRLTSEYGLCRHVSVSFINN